MRREAMRDDAVAGGSDAFDHPWLSGLVGDDETAAAIGPEAELRAMVAFEVALAASEAEAGVIGAEAALAIETALADLRPDVGALRSGCERDGVVVPELVRQLRATVGEHGASVHLGSTSQDVIDTALVLRVRPALELFERRIVAAEAALDDLDRRYGARSLMAHTRMQAAMPFTVGDRLRSWRVPLARSRSRLAGVREEVLVVQFGGAVGTLDKLGDRSEAVRAGLAARLGLGDVPAWHSQRDRIMVLGGWLAQVTGTLGKIGGDVALLAQAGEDIALAGGGGSSAMPHKQNPVGAEVLVALARFNAGQLGCLNLAMVHEQERSGSAWTLEWLVLPQMLLATGGALRHAVALLEGVVSLGR